MWKVMELNDYKSVGKTIPPCAVSVCRGLGLSVPFPTALKRYKGEGRYWGPG